MCVPKILIKEVGDLKSENNVFIDRQQEGQLNWVPLRFGETNNQIDRVEPLVAEPTNNIEVLTFVDDIIVIRREV